jgi:hypothetical protein
VISQYGSKFGAIVSSLALLGTIGTTVLPAAAHSAPAPVTVASASQAGSDCGSIEFGSGTPDIAAIHAATDCLQHAYASCTPTQLAITWDGATERVDRLLTIAQPDDGGCQIVDQVTRTAKSTGVDSSDIYTCNSLTADANGITVRKCGLDGDVVLEPQPGS